MFKAVSSFKERVCSRLHGKCVRDHIIQTKTYEIEIAEEEFVALPKDIIENLVRETEIIEQKYPTVTLIHTVMKTVFGPMTDTCN